MKKLKKEKIKKNKSQLIEIGSCFLIILSFGALSYQIYSNSKKNQINDNMIQEFFEDEKVPEENTKTEEKTIEPETKKEVNYEKYMGVLEIEKINVKRGFYSKQSRNNNVNKNIKILNESDMPDKENGNVIIAAHSGNSYVAFFKNLNKLNAGDIAKIYYEGKTYYYSLVNSYEINKNGTAHIVRNAYKNTLSLITCKSKTNKQIVFIFELKEIK